MTIDLSTNKKQELFFNTAVNAVFAQNEFRYLFYGGAIRGGKSFVCATLFLLFARKFNNSRWHIFRSDFPALQATTIPTFEKIIAGNRNFRWSRDKSNYFLEYIPNASKIYFKGENITHDKELNDLLGLETNGIWLEQIEELTEKLWQISISRNGSWYIDPMPAPLLLATFNPTQTWVKERIHIPHRDGLLTAPYYYLQALPTDNPHVTKEQWSAWQMMDDRYKQQFIEGDWTNFSDGDNRWAFAFDRKKHLGPVELDRKSIVYLSFDFNKNPITCAVIQHISDTIKVVEQIRLTNSDIYAICTYIRVSYPNCLFIITGDSSGSNRSALVRDNLNYYTVIKAELNVSSNQLKVPTFNPSLAENQVLVNSLLRNYKFVIDPDKCKPLIYDLENVKMLADGSIVKGNRDDIAQQADCLDCLRYYCNTFHSNFLKINVGKMS